MRRVTSARSVLESSPASHARLTPRYASRSAAAYPGLIVSGILLTHSQKRRIDCPARGLPCELLRSPDAGCNGQCLSTGTHPGELSDLSSRRQLRDPDVALAVVDREEESPRADREVGAMRRTREVVEPDQHRRATTR